MSHPNIAVIGAKWRDGAGGGATFEEDVLSALFAHPLEQKLVMYPASAKLKTAVKESGMSEQVTLVKAIKDPRLPGRLLRRAGRFVRRRRAPLPFAALAAAVGKAGAQCAWVLGGSVTPLDMPYVATIRGIQHRMQPWFPEYGSGGVWRERERLDEEYYRRAALVITGTAAGARELREAYGDCAGVVQVVPLPTPAFAIAAGMRPRGPRPTGVPPRYLFYPAAFAPHKNHVTAVQAVGALRSIAGAPHLVLTGADAGTMSHVMQEARALGIPDRVHSLGFVDRQRLIALYQHAEALLYPALSGPDNLPPLEAMALGCPVIAARVSGADEQIGDAGVLVDPLDALGFATAVRSLRYDPEARDAMVERGRLRARNWTSAQYVDTIISLINTRIGPIRALWP